MVMDVSAPTVEQTCDKLSDGAGASTVGVKQGVDFDDIEGANEPRLVEHLHHQASFREGYAASYRHIDAGDNCRVYEISVQANVQRSVALCHSLKNAPYWCADPLLLDRAHV